MVLDLDKMRPIDSIKIIYKGREFDLQNVIPVEANFESNPLHGDMRSEVSLRLAVEQILIKEVGLSNMVIGPIRDDIEDDRITADELSKYFS